MTQPISTLCQERRHSLSTMVENVGFFPQNFSEILHFGHRQNERGGQNVDGINIQKFCQKSEKYRLEEKYWQFFLKKNQLQLKKNGDISVYFAKFFADFLKKSALFTYC